MNVLLDILPDAAGLGPLPVCNVWRTEEKYKKVIKLRHLIICIYRKLIYPMEFSTYVSLQIFLLFPFDIIYLHFAYSTCKIRIL